MADKGNMSKLQTQATWGCLGLQVIVAMYLVLEIRMCWRGQDRAREDTVHNAKAWALINKLASRTNMVSEFEDWKKLASAFAHAGINGTKAQEYHTRAHAGLLGAIKRSALSALGVLLISICLSSLSLIRLQKLARTSTQQPVTWQHDARSP